MEISIQKFYNSDPCWSVLDFWKIEFENQVQQTGFLVYFKLDSYCLCSLQESKLDFSNLIFQKSSTDQPRGLGL
jgi:hypothetical protein